MGHCWTNWLTTSPKHWVSWKPHHPAGINYSQVLQAAVLLSATGALSPAQDEAATERAKKHTDKLNVHLMHKARSSNDVTHLASPVTGGGVSVGRFQQLFLLARINGHQQPAEWSQFAWNVLAAQGQRIVKDDKPLETAEDNLAELTAQASTFADKQLPALIALQIA